MIKKLLPKVLVCAVFSTLSYRTIAQIQSLFDLSARNFLLSNPGSAAAEDKIKIRMDAVYFPGGQITLFSYQSTIYTLFSSFELPLKKLNSGLAIDFRTSENKYLYFSSFYQRKRNIGLSYNYKIKINTCSNIRIGIRINYLDNLEKHHFRTGWGYRETEKRYREAFYTGDAGIWYQSGETTRIGLAIANDYQYPWYYTGYDSKTHYLAHRLNFMAERRIDLPGSWSLSPAIKLAQFYDRPDFTAEAYVDLAYAQKVWIGIGALNEQWYYRWYASRMGYLNVGANVFKRLTVNLTTGILVREQYWYRLRYMQGHLNYVQGGLSYLF